MSIFDFTEFYSFYKEYNPLTPYGKSEKAKMEIFISNEYLEKEYFLISKVKSLILNNPNKAATIEYHLKRISDLNFIDNEYFSCSDLFLIKKFLFNYKCVSEQIHEELLRFLFIKFEETALYSKLNLNDEKETFYLSEKYSLRLQEIRNKIKELDSSLSDMKKKHLMQIKEKTEFDFRFQNFIVVDEAKALGLDEKFVFKESFDSCRVIIKPVFTKEYFELHSKKETLIREEKEEEKKVQIELSEDVKKEINILKKYISSIHKFDVILAKASIAQKYNMTKPVLNKFGENIKVVNGICLPVKNHCKELDTEYFPLTVSFDNHIIVISGSNMGGKTVVLKTIALLQLLAQMGFWVPAEEYSTVLFSELNYIGDLQHRHAKGLSSYGIEIYSFIKATSDENVKSLYLIDEFAGTTNSIEAEALISAILTEFDSKNKAYAFLSTHFMNLIKLQNISFYRMKGLDSEKYEKYFNTEKEYDFIERIKLINSFMRYEIEPDQKCDNHFDALKVAEILGLNPNIIKTAKNILNT